ncbi:Hydrolase pyvD-like protein [Cladobotryum mycophilum]|uniref:Hydrolase pyvD-like protein n=1 Tax=Cladobotryum mycophilum TaxID=491253 RepID=A0ABR0S7X9_9HYPO
MSCPDCFKGHVHEGTPTGNITKIHGRNTYVALPPEGVDPKGIIVIIPDAFGWEFVNNRLLVDHYAILGSYTVYLPDFMDGKPAPLWLLDLMPKLTDNSSVWDTLRKPWYISKIAYGAVPFFLSNRFGVAWPKILSFFQDLRAEEGATLPIGTAGFCWGGKPVLTLAHSDMVCTSNGRPLVDAVFTGHPSGVSLPDDVEKITKPVSMAIGDKDMVMSMAQIDSVRNTWGNMSNEVPTEVVVYDGAGHGFCVRADAKNEKQDQQSRDAENQAIAWFGKHLK